MKITNDKIAPSLRFMGGVYRTAMKNVPLVPLSRKNAPTDQNRRTYSVYLTRPDGSRLRLLVSKPRKKSSLPGVLWLHGGGYATGMPEMLHFSAARHIKNDCVIVSPEYTLSIVKPYPAALLDCYAALRWMVRHAGVLGIDDTRIFVGGESAGGGLTAAVCLLARDLGEVNIACQMPLYPMLDDRPTKSCISNNAPVWDSKKNRDAWALYLAELKKIPAYAAPARAANLAGMPPAITFVGDIEPFFDETVAYVNALTNADIPVDFRVFPGCYHAFDMMVPWSKEAKESAKFFQSAFRRAAERYRRPQPQSRT